MMKRFRQIFVFIAALAVLLAAVPAAKAAGGSQIVSAYYGINRDAGLIGQVALGTDSATLLSRMVQNGELSLATGVHTGSELVLTANGEAADKLTLVVQADCNGDGGFSVTDMLMVKSLLLNQQSFSPSQAQAGDVSGDGSVTITDFLQMKSQVLKLSDFTLRPLTGTQLPACRLMAVGETFAFGPTGAAAPSTPPDSATPTVSVAGDAVTWANGTLTAVKEGSAQVSYQEESLLIVVTAEPQGIRFREDSLILSPNTTAQAQIQLTHPLNTPVAYQSSDAAIATVDQNGLITALREGSATITASLQNGASAQMSVQVLPLIQSISLNESSIKVKPGSSKTLTASIAPAESKEPLIWASSDPAIATVSADGVVTGVAHGTVTITCTSQYGQVSASCQVKVCDLVQVALTFDDGPSASYTGPLLDVLNSYDIDATFFLVGNRIAGCESLLQRFVNEGHEIGYHTWAHTYFYDMSYEQIQNDFNSFQSTVYNACGGQATVYRSPGGGITDNALSAIPLPHIMWSVDTRDWETRDTYSVCYSILNNLDDGAIILLHDIHDTTYYGTVAALEQIISQDMDVEFMTVTELLSRGGTPPSAGNTYYYG